MNKHLIRIIVVLSFALICVLGIFVCSANALNLDADVIEIRSNADFKEFAQSVDYSRNYSGQTVKLFTNIGPIDYIVGKIGCSFEGTFDGQGHTITVNYHYLGYDVGVFSSLNHGTIKNLIVDGKIESGEEDSIGGIVGYMYEGTVINCTNKADIIASRGSEIGGIVGDASFSKIINCANYGKIVGLTEIGGIAGEIYKSEVKNVLSTPDITYFIVQKFQTKVEKIAIGKIDYSTVVNAFTENTKETVSKLNNNLPNDGIAWVYKNNSAQIYYSSVFSGSFLSGGNIAIIAVVVIAAGATFFVIKKKKMTA